MGWAIRMNNGGEEECILNIGMKAIRKETTNQTKM
jgi:hypothetical protein